MSLPGLLKYVAQAGRGGADAAAAAPRAAEKPSAGARETRSRRRTTVPRRDPQAGRRRAQRCAVVPAHRSEKKKPVTLVSMMIPG